MRRLTVSLLGASATLAALAGPAAAAPTDGGPLIKDRGNDICLAPTVPNHDKPQQPGHSTCEGSRGERSSVD